MLHVGCCILAAIDCGWRWEVWRCGGVAMWSCEGLEVWSRRLFVQWFSAQPLYFMFPFFILYSLFYVSSFSIAQRP